MRSKIFAILLAAALVSGGLGSFSYVNAQPPDDEVNIAEVSYTSFRIYTAPENTFANREVTGNTWWGTDLFNLPDATEEAIAGAELSLGTNLTLDCYFLDPFIDATMVTEGPSPYEWGFGDVGEEEMRLVFVHPTNPADEVLGTFTPGFNASVSVDRVQFLQSQGTQTQTLTIEVEKVDPDAYFILIVSTVTLFPFLPADEGDLVEAVIIPPFPEWTELVFPGGTGFIMETMHIEPYETATYELSIEVTPKVPSVEYKPTVFLASQGPYPERQSHFGNSHSFEVDSLGTWTWNAEGEYDWQWRYIDRGAVVFPGISSEYAVTDDMRDSSGPMSETEGIETVTESTIEEADAIHESTDEEPSNQEFRIDEVLIPAGIFVVLIIAGLLTFLLIRRRLSRYHTL